MLDAYATNAAIHIPLVGGVEIGLVQFAGSGIKHYDVGAYVTTKKKHGGIALAKGTIGVSQTFGGRNNFDGVDAEASLGLLDVGITAGGLAENQMPNSLGFDVGPQIGYEVNKTITLSLTIGDIARAIARFLYGDGGSIFDNSTDSCGN